MKNSYTKRKACQVCQGKVFKDIFQRSSHQYAKCMDCGLIRIDPPPSDEELKMIYSSNYFDSWGENTKEAPANKLKALTFRRHVLKSVSLNPGARILDCGAAFGALMDVAFESGLDPYGVELIPSAASQIAERFGADHLFCGEFESSTFSNLPRESAFDAVFMCDFIEHVRDPLAVLKKAARWLLKDGVLVITTPDTGSISSQILKSKWPLFDIEHLHCFNQKNMRILLENAGLQPTWSGAARKVVTLEYLRRQISGRPQSIVTKIIRFFSTTPGLSELELSFSLGQMLVVAKKIS